MEIVNLILTVSDIAEPVLCLTRRRGVAHVGIQDLLEALPSVSPSTRIAAKVCGTNAYLTGRSRSGRWRGKT